MTSAPDARAPRTRSDRLQGIQLARGLAALLVVLYHCGRLISLPQYVGHIPFGGIFNFGHAGVDFFFALSGFIIMHVHRDDIGKPRQLPRYMWRRIIRIYPTYWLVSVLLLGLALARPGGWPDYDAEYLLRSFLLLPQPREPVVGVAWTLVHEMLFYTAFATLVLNRRLGQAVMLAWAVSIALGLAGWLTTPTLGFIGSFHHVQFLIGALAALAAPTIAARTGAVLAAIGAAGFLAAGIAENGGMFTAGGIASQALFGVASGLIVLGLAAAERGGSLNIGRLGAFLGAASYSIYLIHVTVISLTARVLAELGVIGRLPPAAVFGIAGIAAILAGGCLYQFAERPSLTWLQRFGARQVHARAAQR